MTPAVTGLSVTDVCDNRSGCVTDASGFKSVRYAITGPVVCVTLAVPAVEGPSTGGFAHIQWLSFRCSLTLRDVSP